MSRFLNDDFGFAKSDLSNINAAATNIINSIVSDNLIDPLTMKLKENILPRLTISTIFQVNSINDRDMLINDIPLVQGDVVKINNTHEVFIFDGSIFIQIFTDLNLQDLLNIQLQNLQNNEYLKYDSISSKWINKKINLSHLENIDINDVNDKNLLQFDSNLNKFKPYQNIIDNITNVEISNPEYKHVLMYNGVDKWTNNIISINSIYDVFLDNLQDKDMLMYDAVSTNFINYPAYQSKLSQQGDILMFDSFIEKRLPITNNRFLKSVANTPTWSEISYDDIINFSVTTPLNSQALVYNSTISKFQNQNIYQSVLNTNGDILYYNNGHQRLGIGSAEQILRVIAGLPSWTTVSNIDSIIKTSLTSPVSSNFLKFNGVDTWVNSNITMSNISDVNITTPLNNQVLTYNTSQLKWINTTPSSSSSPLVANEDIYIRRSGVDSRLPIGNSNQILKVIGGQIAYTTDFPANFYHNSALNSIVLSTNVTSATPPTSSIVIGTNNNLTNIQSLSGSVLIGNSIRTGPSVSGNVYIGLNIGNSGFNNAGHNVAIGANALFNEGANTSYAIAIGELAGRNINASDVIAIGRNTVFNTSNTCTNSIIIGAHTLGNGSIAANNILLGLDCGIGNVGSSNVCIGDNCATTSCGSYNVLLGKSTNSSASNSIVLNASNTSLNNTINNSFIVKPVRSLSLTTSTLMYDVGSGEISYNPSVSSQIVKKDIEYLSCDNEMIAQAKLLQPVSFHFKNQDETVPKTLGFIAEDIHVLSKFNDCTHMIEKITVDEEYSNVLGLDYNKMNIKLWLIVQKLINLNECNKNMIIQLQNRLSILENQ